MVTQHNKQFETLYQLITSVTSSSPVDNILNNKHYNILMKKFFKDTSNGGEMIIEKDSKFSSLKYISNNHLINNHEELLIQITEKHLTKSPALLSMIITDFMYICKSTENVNLNINETLALSILKTST